MSQIGMRMHRPLLIIFILACLHKYAASSAAAASNAFLSFDWPNLALHSSGGEGNISSSPDEGYVDLTGTSNNDDVPQLSVGRLFYPDLLPLWSGSTLESASFNCSFRFRIVNQSVGQTGHGDGLAFVLLDPATPNVLNTSKGSYLGLFNGTTDHTSVGVVAVEFDTYKNYFDPDGNHIGIDVNSITSSTNRSGFGFTLASSADIFAWVDYSSSQALLEVYATSQSDVKPTSSPLLSLSINLTGYLPESVRIGFSASTGGGDADHHRLYSWSFNSSAIKIAAPQARKRLSAGEIGGLVVGIVVALVILLVVLYCCVCRRRHGGQRSRSSLRKQESGPTSMGANVELTSQSGGLRRFTYTDLVEATNGFDNNQLLGTGGYGSVYRGVLSKDGCELQVAVKCLSQKLAAEEIEKTFLAELRIISNSRHRNLVQLEGSCEHEGNLFLVYEYLPNRSLDCHLYGKLVSSPPLAWSKRYNVVCGLGSAIYYLHEGYSPETIVHRDIKASNVMLDANFKAKLGDFGLARQLGDGAEAHSTLPAGTPGYVAPEVLESGRATKESDVYSYGVVLLEAACGRPAIDGSLPSNPLIQNCLVYWVWDLHSKERLVEARDSRLGSGAFVEVELVRTLTMGLACTHPDPKLRPPIGWTLEALQGRVALPTIPTFRPVAHFGPPPRRAESLLTSSSAAAATSAASFTSAHNSDLSEIVVL